MEYKVNTEVEMDKKLLVSIEYLKETQSFRIVNLGSIKVPVIKDGKVLAGKTVVDDVSLNDLIENLKLSEYNREHNEVYVEDGIVFVEISEDITPIECGYTDGSYEISFKITKDEQLGIVIFPRNYNAKVVRDGEIKEYYSEKLCGYEFSTFEDFIKTLEINEIFKQYNKIKFSDAVMIVS